MKLDRHLSCGGTRPSALIHTWDYPSAPAAGGVSSTFPFELVPAARWSCTCVHANELSPEQLNAQVKIRAGEPEQNWSWSVQNRKHETSHTPAMTDTTLMWNHLLFFKHTHTQIFIRFLPWSYKHVLFPVFSFMFMFVCFKAQTCFKVQCKINNFIYFYVTVLSSVTMLKLNKFIFWVTHFLCFLIIMSVLKFVCFNISETNVTVGY